MSRFITLVDVDMVSTRLLVTTKQKSSLREYSCCVAYFIDVLWHLNTLSFYRCMFAWRVKRRRSEFNEINFCPAVLIFCFKVLFKILFFYWIQGIFNLDIVNKRTNWRQCSLILNRNQPVSKGFHFIQKDRGF